MDENSIKNLKKALKKDKKLLIIVIAAVIALVLLIIPEFGLDSAKQEKTNSSEEKEVTYLENTEKRLKDIIGSIEGAGNAKVMVTLENSAEQVYAQNEKHKSDSDSGLQRPKSSNTNEHEYVLIKSSSKGEEGLIIKLVEPKIRGVAIVCEGGGSDRVKQEIIETVTAVLDISASRVYVAKMG